MTEASMTQDIETNEKKLTGWHVLFIMLGFFGVIFAVNGVFLYNAITSFPGEDIKKSYVQGLNYNQTLESRAAQAEMGWQAQAGIEDGTIIFRLQDKNGEALSNYPVLIEARRLTNDAEDQVITLKATGRGEYSAPADMLASGQWRLKVSVLDYDAEETLFVAEKQVRAE